MPIPFESFRLLNGSGKPVKSVKYRGSTKSGVQETKKANNTELLDEQAFTVDPIAEGRIVDQPPLDPAYVGVRMLAVTSLAIVKTTAQDQGPQAEVLVKLPLWELSYEAVGGGGEDDAILSCELFVQKHPDDENNAWYCLARLRFADGSLIDYQSPMLT